MLREFPGTGTDSPAARIGWGRWQDYFPGRHLLSEAFFSLRTDFAVSHAAGVEKWVARDLLGDHAFEPWHTFDATAVIDNSRLLGATSHWMRAGDHEDPFGMGLFAAGPSGVVEKDDPFADMPQAPLVRPRLHTTTTRSHEIGGQSPESSLEPARAAAQWRV